MKQTILLSSITFSLLVIMLSGCNYGYDDCHNTIYLKNNSNKSIYYVSTLKQNFFNYDPTNPEYAADQKIDSDEEINVRIGIQLSCWEQVLENAGGYVYIYIYDAAYLEGDVAWQDAKSNYTKEYKLSVKDLQQMKWRISFS